MRKTEVKTEEGIGAVDTLFLSDPHLLLPGSREEAVRDVIARTEFRRLVLGGDTFQYFRPKRITARQWRFLYFLENLAKERPGTEIVLLTGNHDRQMIKMRRRLNVTIADEYAWSCGGRKYLAIHGHQFKRVSFDFTLRYELSCRLYGLTRIFGRKRKKRVRVYADKLYKRTEPSRRQAVKAIAYGRAHGVDSIICGHTHEPLRLEAGDIEFINGGSSYFTPSTYLTIDRQGAEFHEF